jgi:hypothetical protein
MALFEVEQGHFCNSEIGRHVGSRPPDRATPEVYCGRSPQRSSESTHGPHQHCSVAESSADAEPDLQAVQFPHSTARTTVQFGQQFTGNRIVPNALGSNSVCHIQVA